jgi:dienelactone hydrolase
MIDFSRSKFCALTTRLLLIGLPILCAVGCSTSDSLNFAVPKCFESHPPSIGKDLVVGESSDELVRKVGEPNQVIKHKEYTYYVYYLPPGFDSKHLLLCDQVPTEDWSSYLVTFDSDMKVLSVVYDMFAAPDSQRVTVPGADGLMLPATLYRPRGCARSREPAIVLLHGWLVTWRDLTDEPSSVVWFLPNLAWALLHRWHFYTGGTDAVGMEAVAQLLAEHGYVVLLPVMRPWGGGDQNDCGPSQSADTKRMIEWLAVQPGVDPDRIGVMGGSFGGQVALLTGALSPRVKAIISDSGPTDYVSLNAQAPWYFPSLDALLPSWYPKECKSDLESRSPVNVASRIKAPVLLIQGDADTTTLPEQAEEMEQALRESGGSVQLYVVSGAEHQDADDIFLSSWTATQQFLEANLGKPSCVQTLHAPSASPRPTPPALRSQ